MLRRFFSCPITYNFTLAPPGPSTSFSWLAVRTCQDWLLTILEAALQRRNAARRRKYHLKTLQRQQASEQDRTGYAPSIAPAIHLSPPLNRGTRSRPLIQLPSRPQVLSTTAFYRAHPGRNRWLKVRTGRNITGQLSERGVFAICHIPPHTRLAPYLGEVCDAESRGPYCLHVKDAENELICLDAHSQLYNIGYLTHLSAYRSSRTPAPPNYARFVNSLTPDH